MPSRVLHEPAIQDMSLTRHAPSGSYPSEPEPPPYESINQPTVHAAHISPIPPLTPQQPIIVTFKRFSYVHMNTDPARTRNYVGRRVQKKTDVAFILRSTSWDDFAVSQILRSLDLFHWDEDIANFAFCVVMRLRHREIRVDPANWYAARDLMLFKEESAEFIFSVCPRTPGKPSMLKVVECSVLETVRKMRTFVMRR